MLECEPVSTKWHKRQRDRKCPDHISDIRFFMKSRVLPTQYVPRSGMFSLSLLICQQFCPRLVAFAFVSWIMRMVFPKARRFGSVFVPFSFLPVRARAEGRDSAPCAAQAGRGRQPLMGDPCGVRGGRGCLCPARPPDGPRARPTACKRRTQGGRLCLAHPDA